MKQPKKCPECGSKNLVPFMGFETGMQYKCVECGWIGVLALVDDDSQKKPTSRKATS